MEIKFGTGVLNGSITYAFPRPSWLSTAEVHEPVTGGQ